RPFFKLGVVRDAALERDCFKLGAARRLSPAAGIASFPMLHHFRGPLERADFADTGDVTSVPLYSEFEDLVRVEALWINTELSHEILLGLGFDLPGELLDLNDDKFRRFERCKAHKDVHDAVIDIGLCCGFAVALNEIRFTRRFPLKRALSEETLHECSDV